jgi:hypothetical protein
MQTKRTLFYDLDRSFVSLVSYALSMVSLPILDRILDPN